MGSKHSFFFFLFPLSFPYRQQTQPAAQLRAVIPFHGGIKNFSALLPLLLLLPPSVFLSLELNLRLFFSRGRKKMAEKQVLKNHQDPSSHHFPSVEKEPENTVVFSFRRIHSAAAARCCYYAKIRRLPRQKPTFATLYGRDPRGGKKLKKDPLLRQTDAKTGEEKKRKGI